jgi:hypothetical protein
MTNNFVIVNESLRQLPWSPGLIPSGGVRVGIEALKQVVSASAVIRADAKRVYAIISDYRGGHPRIPPPQLRGLVVEHGGVGEGTIIRFEMRLLGTSRTLRGAVSEP